MGEIRQPPPALLILAAFSRHDEALQWAEETGTSNWGPRALASEVFDFADTNYYEPTMGAGLRKVFYAFENLIDPAELIAIKRLANQLEEDYRAAHAHAEPRPLNLDPGYITSAKLVLATTKDRDHRLFLGEGIYAEVTLHYHDGAWRARPWTYPDYAREDYHEFFRRCREYLRDRQRSPHPPSGRVER